MPLRHVYWLRLIAVSCHLRFIFLAYPHCTHRYGRVGIEGSWFWSYNEEVINVGSLGILEFIILENLEIFLWTGTTQIKGITKMKGADWKERK